MELILNNFNPWWRLKRVPTQFLGKPRDILSELKESLSLRHITLISGLRRVGKTTLIFQLIHWLLEEKEVLPEQILYYSFDEARFSVNEIFEFYQTQILQEEVLNQKRLYFFFDEIQKLPGWAEQVKILYDMHPNLKITLSGSANLKMKAGSRESLAGRFFDYEITTLDFEEFLRFRSIEVEPKKEVVFRSVLVREFNQLLKTGGFIEAIPFDDIQLIRYFKESILERVTYRDIPGVFSISVPDLLQRLLMILAQRPGLYLDYKNLASDLQVDQRTVTNYFDYLQYSYLVQKLYNFSTNLLSSEKKLKRVYLSNTGFTFALMGEMNFPVLVEQFWINFLRAKYFYRSPQKDEVDLVLADNQAILTIEIKIRETFSVKTAGSLLKFMRRFGLKKGLMITLQTETELARNDRLIKVLPYWKYWTIKKRIDEIMGR